MTGLFVSDKLPEKVMSEVIQKWMDLFVEKEPLYRAMGVESLTIRPVMFGFVLEPVFAASEIVTDEAAKEAV